MHCSRRTLSIAPFAALALTASVCWAVSSDDPEPEQTPDHASRVEAFEVEKFGVAITKTLSSLRGLERWSLRFGGSDPEPHITPAMLTFKWSLTHDLSTAIWITRRAQGLVSEAHGLYLEHLAFYGQAAHMLPNIKHLAVSLEELRLGTEALPEQLKAIRARGLDLGESFRSLEQLSTTLLWRIQNPHESLSPEAKVAVAWFLASGTATLRLRWLPNPLDLVLEIAPPEIGQLARAWAHLQGKVIPEINKRARKNVKHILRPPSAFEKKAVSFVKRVRRLKRR